MKFKPKKAMVRLMYSMILSIYFLLLLFGGCETKEVQDSRHVVKDAHCDDPKDHLNKQKPDVVDLSDEGNTGCSLESTVQK